jgi:hypothetical protein
VNKVAKTSFSLGGGSKNVVSPKANLAQFALCQQL